MFVNSNQLDVISSVVVRDPCEMRYMVTRHREVEFTFGSGDKSFELLFGRVALRKFLKQAANALMDVDTEAKGAGDPR